MKHEPGPTGYVHAPVASAHVSVVQERPSAHVEAVAQSPDVSQTPQPAGDPSLQRAPARGVHALALDDGSHERHGLVASIVPAA
jgi:hypothetical protein